MIYYFLYEHLQLQDTLSLTNVLRYIPFRFLAATMTAMLLAFGMYPSFIRRLRSAQIGQVVRTDGPESHFSKAGTPTMGGSLILVAMTIAVGLWADPRNALVWVVMLVTIGYGWVGFIDDTSKIRTKSSGGLAGRYKLLFQFAIALGAMGWLFYGDAGLPSDWLVVRDRLALPFVAFSKAPIELPKWLYVAFGSFVIVGSSNAVNLTDGLDGLAIGPVMIASATFAVLCYVAGLSLFGYVVAEYLDIAPVKSAGELCIICGALVGAGFGFLWYNTYPAQIFMGDVGSLALGGCLGMISILSKNEFLWVLLGGIFVTEAVSVIIQVAFFRATGRRIFLMAPIHHHFEKKGWPEPRVIVRFWIISVMLSVASLATLKLR